MCLYYPKKKWSCNPKIGGVGRCFSFSMGNILEGSKPLAFRGVIHPQSLTWNLKMMVSKRNLLFQGLIFRFHVKLPGCISSSNQKIVLTFSRQLASWFSRAEIFQGWSFPPWMNFLGKKRTWPMVEPNNFWQNPNKMRATFWKYWQIFFCGGTYFLIKILINTVDGSEIPKQPPWDV